jgi:hypothetical protein
MDYEGSIMINTPANTVFPWQAWWIAGAIAGLTAGCAGPSALEEDFGKSVRQMRYVQTYDKTTLLEPQLEPVRGIDGQAAAETLKDYRKTFSTPTTDPIKQEIIFTVGGASGGGP